MILVSSCLLGVKCRYDGSSREDKRILELAENSAVIPVCPEQLGGCPTPRPAAEISGGTGADVLDGKARVINKEGEDVTDHFVKGAEEVLKLAKRIGADQAILKAGSPSCGCGYVYDGSFSGVVIDGNGVTAELLERNNIKVLTEKMLLQKT